MIDSLSLAVFSELKGNTLWCFYNQALSDWDKQVMAARQRHVLAEDNPVTVICRPMKEHNG